MIKLDVSDRNVLANISKILNKYFVGKLHCYIRDYEYNADMIQERCDKFISWYNSVMSSYNDDEGVSSKDLKIPRDFSLFLWDNKKWIRKILKDKTLRESIIEDIMTKIKKFKKCMKKLNDDVIKFDIT